MFTGTGTGTCTGCILILVATVLLILFVGLFVRTLTGTRTQTERFDTIQISAATSSILDDRCLLNADISIDTGLGLVRHPTDSHPGSCVVGGAIPGNGVCDDTNSVLYDARYVSSIHNEMVDGQSQCVIRMHQGLDNDDARAYGDSLTVNNIELSSSFISLKAEKVQCSNDKAILSSQLLTSRGETATANSNWQDQITRDRITLKNALQVQGDTDATTLADQMAQDTAFLKQSMLDEQARGEKAVKDEKVLSAQALHDQSNTDDQALTQAVQVEYQRGAQLVKDARALALTQIKAQTQSLTDQAQKNQFLFFDGNLPYHDYTNQRRNDANECRQWCQSQTKCTHFAFDTRNNQCFLKEGGGTAAPEYASQGGGFMSGVSVDNYPRG